MPYPCEAEPTGLYDDGKPVRYHARPTRKQALFVLLSGLKITLKPEQVTPLYSYPPPRHP